MLLMPVLAKRLIGTGEVDLDLELLTEAVLLPLDDGAAVLVTRGAGGGTGRLCTSSTTVAFNDANSLIICNRCRLYAASR